MTSEELNYIQSAGDLQWKSAMAVFARVEVVQE